MSSDFRELVNMYANQSKMIETLRDELGKSEEARTDLYRKLQAEHDENQRLKGDVQTALHGRIKEHADQCNATAMPMPMETGRSGPSLGPAMERITEREEPQRFRPINRCSTCGRDL